MSHLTNPLATADQLYNAKHTLNSLPIELQDSIRYYTARLTQAAGILLRLPQDITAQANILLFRYWISDPLMAWEFSDVSAAVIYLTAKISASPRSLRSITNVYAYLGSAESSLGLKVKEKEKDKLDGESYYLSESRYITFRNRLLNIEGQILAALGFQTHVALPHPLAITYLQALDIFTPKNKATNVSTSVAKRTIQYLNIALLSPQMLYLTHQPNVLAVAAVYLACREENLRLPESEWWEVFDVEREELGFVVVGMRSVESFAKEEGGRWEGVDILKRGDVREDLARRGFGNENGVVEEDEETRMARLLDEKVGAV